MNLKELKLYMLDRHAQVVIFTLEGLLESSCNSLCDLSPFIGKSLYDASPLMASMRSQIVKLQGKSEVIKLPAVEDDFLDFTKVFDIEFVVHPADDKLRIWLILDRTDIYRRMQAVQQERNMLLIAQQQRRKPGADAA